MSFVRVWLHIVFSTKNRESILSKPIREKLFQHIKDYCKEKGIFLRAINGYTDHVHCLVSLDKNQTIVHLMQLIKGESSFWFNQQNLIEGKFSWQDDYFAVSVSESQLKRVIQYINNQEQHHLSKSFIDETNEFMQKYGWVKMKDEK
jgi:putative transposase